MLTLILEDFPAVTVTMSPVCAVSVFSVCVCVLLRVTG